MEIQIIIMSILTYIILVNSSLTFRLNVINNIVIIVILAFNMIIVNHLIGNLFVIPMFIFIILYIGYLKKEDWLWNVFLIIFSYALLVIVDNLTHFIWEIIGLDISVHWPIYMLIDYPIFLSYAVLCLRK